MQNILNFLNNENKFDYVLSHTGPRRINKTLIPVLKGNKSPIIHDKVAVLNERIDRKITCKQWFCGHMHRDKYYYCQDLKRGYQYLYRRTAILDGDIINVL